MEIFITHIDTACVLLEINGYRILTDPTLDRAGKCYHHGFGAISKKTSNPALKGVDLASIDLILLSHHQHKDNFDDRGRAFTETCSNVISTKAASKALKGVVGLKTWETQMVNTDLLKNLKITATPAQHRPWWIPEFVSGEVTGFVIEFDGQENGVIYLSGDTVYFNGIDAVAARYKIDIGIFNVGSVQFRYLTGFGKYTMDGKDLVKAAHALAPNLLIPIHLQGWTHFKEKAATLERILQQNAFTKNKTRFLKSGLRTKLRF